MSVDSSISPAGRGRICREPRRRQTVLHAADRRNGPLRGTFPAAKDALFLSTDCRRSGRQQRSSWKIRSAFRPCLPNSTYHLFGEGNFLYSYEKLGAHFRTMEDVRGVNFAVWAPNAERVSVVGSFNGWDTRAHPMYQT